MASKNAARALRNEHQKNITKMLSGLAGEYSTYTLWQDFVTMAAIAISNTVDHGHAEERERMYLKISEKYAAREMNVFAQIFAEVVSGIEENPDQDFLGEMYMALEIGNDNAGQFFTPYSVCKACSAMAYGDTLKATIADKGWASCNDCACGAGALLLAFANTCKQQGINYQTSVLFVAQDIDYTVACMCYIQLSLMGCPGYVVIADSISSPAISYDGRMLAPVDTGNIWYTPMYFSAIWTGRRVCAGIDALITGNAANINGRKEPSHELAELRSGASAGTGSKPEFTADEVGQLSLF